MILLNSINKNQVNYLKKAGRLMIVNRHFLCANQNEIGIFDKLLVKTAKNPK